MPTQAVLPDGVVSRPAPSVQPARQILGYVQARAVSDARKHSRATTGRRRALVRNIIEDRETGKANLTGMRTIGVSAREAQEARALTCGMIACIDDAIGARARARSMRRRARQYRGDIHHRSRRPSRRSPVAAEGCEQYQSILQVPFIWSDPRLPVAAATDAIGSTMDIPATILDRARIAAAMSACRAKA